MSSGNYFDFWNLLNNELIGDTNIFIVFGLIIIWYIGFKFKFPFEVNLMLSGCWLLMIFNETGNILIYSLVGLGAAFAFYYALKDAMTIGS